MSLKEKKRQCKTAKNDTQTRTGTTNRQSAVVLHTHKGQKTPEKIHPEFTCKDHYTDTLQDTQNGKIQKQSRTLLQKHKCTKQIEKLEIPDQVRKIILKWKETL